MTNVPLSETQRTILSTAYARRGGRVLPLTVDLKGRAVQIVLKSLLAKGLITETPAKRKDPVWRTNDGGVPLTLRVTQAACAALGIATSGSRRNTDGSERATTGARAPRTDTKQALLIRLLQRPEGATVPDVVAATGWQPHTVRGAIAGALKKRLGLTITSGNEEDRGRVYRVQS